MNEILAPNGIVSCLCEILFDSTVTDLLHLLNLLLILEKIVDQVEEIHEQQHRPVRKIGSKTEVKQRIPTLIFLFCSHTFPFGAIMNRFCTRIRRYIASIGGHVTTRRLCCVETQPLESSLPSPVLIISAILEIIEVLTCDEEGNKEHQSFACLSVQLHICCVNDEEKHESEVPEMVKVLSSIDEEADQHKRLDVFQDEEEELVER